MEQDFPSEAKDWTPIFTRLRTEALILSILIFLLSQVGIKLNKIPFIPVEPEHTIPLGLIVVGLNLAFAIVFVNAIVRCRAELQRTGMPSSIFEDTKTHLSKTRANLEEFQEVPSSRILQNLTRQLALIAESYPTDTIAPQRFQETLQASLQSLERISELSDSARADVVDIYEKLIFRIKKLRSVFTWDKIVFGAILPLAISATLFGLAAPQSIVDARPVIVRAFSCVRNFEGACFFRQQGDLTKDSTPSPIAGEPAPASDASNSKNREF